jgi:hypothetical protein
MKLFGKLIDWFLFLWWCSWVGMATAMFVYVFIGIMRG